MTDLIGCDFSVKPHPSVAALKAAKLGFVGRYADGRPDFDITPPEAEGYDHAGIDVILFCERGVADWMRHAGEAGGAAAASVADAVARECGMHGVPVFFACDFDAQPSDQAAIDATLRGCASKIGSSRVGLYGGIGPVSRALDHGTARFACQTVAWSGGHWDPRVHVRQYQQFTLDGARCDLDVAMKADFGQWPRPVVSHGPHRHVADGRETLAEVARRRGTSVAHLLGVSAESYTGADITDLGGLVLPAGMPFYTTNP